LPKGRVEQQAKEHDSHSRGGFPGVTAEVVKFIAARKCVAQGKLRELVEKKYSTRRGSKAETKDKLF
jgi:hypothetical protein